MGKENALIPIIINTINQAASGQKVLMIVILVGKNLSVSKEEIAHFLSEEFPYATVKLKNGGKEGTVTVKEIEVE